MYQDNNLNSLFLQPLSLGCWSWRCCKEGPSGIYHRFCGQYSRDFTSDLWSNFQLQALEGLKLAEKDPNGGRRLTSQGRRDLDRIAAQIKLAAAEKAKKAAAAEAVIAIA